MPIKNAVLHAQTDTIPIFEALHQAKTLRNHNTASDKGSIIETISEIRHILTSI